MAINHIEKVTLSQTSRSVCTRVRMQRSVWKDKRMINDQICCWVLFSASFCEVKQKRYVIFKKLSVRVIDITFEGEPSRRLNQVRVYQFSKYFVSWANQKPEFLSVSVSFQSFIASLDIV